MKLTPDNAACFADKKKASAAVQSGGGVNTRKGIHHDTSIIPHSGDAYKNEREKSRKSHARQRISGLYGIVT